MATWIGQIHLQGTERTVPEPSQATERTVPEPIEDMDVEGSDAPESPENSSDVREGVQPTQTKLLQWALSLKPTRYRYVDDRGKEWRPGPKVISITYGDFVAYDMGTSWSVGQYLGDGDHKSPHHFRLRKMNCARKDPNRTNPRRVVWRYEWEAQFGINLVAPTRYPHDRPPKYRQGGELTPAWVQVRRDRIFCAVVLNRDRTLEHDSWIDVMDCLCSPVFVSRKGQKPSSQTR